MYNIAAIFAGGVGSRMGSNIPKQFLEIYGKPIIIHTLEKFQYNDNIDYIYVGCKEKYISLLKELVRKYNLTKVKIDKIVSGGTTGLETIYKILKTIKEDYEDAIVLIHDGVRPNITNDVIDRNIESVLEFGNAITCVSSVETIVTSKDGDMIDSYLDRKNAYFAKAPQSFKLTDILKCYQSVLEENGTFDIAGLIDSCSIAIHEGMKLKLVEGNRDNIKVTTPNDYIEILGKLIAVDYSNFLEISTNQ